MLFPCPGELRFPTVLIFHQYSNSVSYCGSLIIIELTFLVKTKPKVIPLIGFCFHSSSLRGRGGGLSGEGVLIPAFSWAKNRWRALF